MIMFIILTIIAWVANACGLRIIHAFIHMNFDDTLLQWDRKGKLFLSKAGGLCELCFSFWWSLLFSPAYLYFISHFVTFNPVMWVIWFLVYHSIATIATVWTLKRM